jgi:hypothetical protein
VCAWGALVRCCGECLAPPWCAACGCAVPVKAGACSHCVICVGQAVCTCTSKATHSRAEHLAVSLGARLLREWWWLLSLAPQ